MFADQGWPMYAPTIQQPLGRSSVVLERTTIFAIMTPVLLTLLV